MNKFAALFLLLGLSIPAVADHKLYEIQNLSGSRLFNVCQLTESLLAAPGGSPTMVRAVPELKVIHIVGTAADIARAEEILKRFDVPQPVERQLRFTIYLVRASTAPPASDLKPRPIPSALESVVAEMKRSFAYTNYNLLDTLEAPVNNRIELQGVLPHFFSSEVQAYFYTLTLSNVSLAADGKTITVDPLDFTVKIPYLAGAEVKEGASGINTKLHFQLGQKLVVGKVNVHATSDTDVFLVLTASL